MTISPTSFLFEVDSGGTIPPDKVAYFEERFRNRLYGFVIREFKKQRDNTGLTQKQVATRLGKRPEQINRWLSGPGNWTLDTVSSLLLAICKGELELDAVELSSRTPRNHRAPDWLTHAPPITALTWDNTDPANYQLNRPIWEGSSSQENAFRNLGWTNAPSPDVTTARVSSLTKEQQHG